MAVEEHLRKPAETRTNFGLQRCLACSRIAPARYQQCVETCHAKFGRLADIPLPCVQLWPLADRLLVAGFDPKLTLGTPVAWKLAHIAMGDGARFAKGTV
ncbi:hypothetical protein GCM10022276_22900 [Sphingomonas limnosediminicola]|uniref:Uncharacterized protein n=1 Tax=Sphingomonas limnosediminicola TaxID=940133 RepID=A0ABP7LLZ1_9SPHN